MRRGFTLIEAITIIAVIGILATLATYTATQAQRYARDAVRKSDLTAVAVSFQARYEALTCSPTDRGHYPGWRDFEYAPSGDWRPVSDLANYSDDCGAFSEFLGTIPRDPRYNDQFPYRYDLGALPQQGKHFRLKTRLERGPGSTEQAEICRLSNVWISTFQGHPYDACGSSGAFLVENLVAATTTGPPPTTDTGLGTGGGGTGSGGGSTGGGTGGGSGGGTGGGTGTTVPPGTGIGTYNYFLGS